MKKIVSLLFVLLLLTGCTSNKFKDEYESLNGKTNASGKTYVEIKVDKKNPMYYASYDEIVDLLEGGTGVIYFGFPECPWCRNAVPVLIEAANELGVDKIYYFNALEMRDNKHLEDGKIIVDKEGTEEYKKLVELMYDHLGPYEGLEDESIKRLYFPTFVFVKDGVILNAHIGTVDSQEDPYVKLNKKQTQELKDIFTEGMNDVFDILCGSKC